MAYATESMHSSERTDHTWIVHAARVSAFKAGRYFLSLMKRSAARERTRKELSELDARMLQDIGLEPFEVYYGWRGAPRSSR